MSTVSLSIKITGLVQGVGFRPFIYKHALKYGIKGTVENNNLGVSIVAEGEKQILNDFVRSIRKEAPQAASVVDISIENIPLNGFKDFSIVSSHSYSDEITEVSPDISVCDDCLEDMKIQPHRLNYPFTNCTNCGPRFTIIKDLPYDRHQTTMDEFQMCTDCEKEYTNILDRRFHAQPVACNHCGPHYTLHTKGKTITDLSLILKTVSQTVADGKIVAIKGLGGFHLACDALNERAVLHLRKLKNREGKPLAVMFGTKDKLKEYLCVNREEENLLTGWRRPIVLLKQKKILSPSISIGLNTVGTLLPYMPFHYLLFEHLQTDALVLTSGNISYEPILIDNRLALKKLGSIASVVVTYNRAIHNRTDDSVSMIVNGYERLIRRSRSYVPSPVILNLKAEGIFAAGAELVNCFAIGKGNQAILSQHIGDLKNMDTLNFYEESVERFKRLFRFRPTLAVADLHSDYLSTQYVREMELPLISVQHHHAHIASCMAENRLDEKVIGISFDGTGLGNDGKIWGGEFLLCDLADFERLCHFEYIPQPGGDLVTRQPWRMAMAYTYHYFGEIWLKKHRALLFPNVNKKSFEAVILMLKHKINCPETSSAGRLFDAVAALTGLCQVTSYHAEAPMQLESVADKLGKEHYPVATGEDVLSFRPLFEVLIKDILNGETMGLISAKFHSALINTVLAVTEKIAEKTKLKKVVLSGGSFQNRILLSELEQLLAKEGLEVFAQSAVPTNDGGIALGQLAIAAKRRSIGLTN